MESHHKPRKDVRDRLSRIEGHVRGIIKMIDEDRTCPDLLIQIAAVRAALNKAGRSSWRTTSSPASGTRSPPARWSPTWWS